MGRRLAKFGEVLRKLVGRSKSDRRIGVAERRKGEEGKGYFFAGFAKVDTYRHPNKLWANVKVDRRNTPDRRKK